jgi:hypothetical protein
VIKKAAMPDMDEGMLEDWDENWVPPKPKQHIRMNFLLVVSIAIQILTCAMLYTMCPDLSSKRLGGESNAKAIILCVLLQSIQWLICIVGFVIVMRCVLERKVALGRATKMYVIQVLSFAGLYLTFFLCWHERLYLTERPDDRDEAFVMTTSEVKIFVDNYAPNSHEMCQHGAGILMLFVYFSSVVQSSVGLGDLVPNAEIAQIVVNVQMFVGMLYAVVIISQVETLYEDQEFAAGRNSSYTLRRSSRGRGSSYRSYNGSEDVPPPPYDHAQHRQQFNSSPLDLDSHYPAEVMANPRTVRPGSSSGPGFRSMPGLPSNRHVGSSASRRQGLVSWKGDKQSDKQGDKQDDGDAYSILGEKVQTRSGNQSASGNLLGRDRSARGQRGHQWRRGGSEARGGITSGNTPRTRATSGGLIGQQQQRGSARPYISNPTSPPLLISVHGPGVSGQGRHDKTCSSDSEGGSGGGNPRESQSGDLLAECGRSSGGRRSGLQPAKKRKQGISGQLLHDWINKRIDESVAIQQSCIARMAQYPTLKKWRKFARRHLLGVVVFIQLLNLLFIYICDAKLFEPPDRQNPHLWKDCLVSDRNIFIAAISTVLQLSCQGVVILTSLKFINRAHSHEVSLIFLGQSYLASIISFAGMYVVAYLYKPYSAFALFTWHEESKGCVFTIWQVIQRLLYFSMTTMTSTGFGTCCASPCIHILYTHPAYTSCIHTAVFHVGLPRPLPPYPTHLVI